MNTLVSAQGSFNLARYPLRKRETLRAWDAADEYLLAEVAESHFFELPTDPRRAAPPGILIVNDNFGALSVALASFQPQMLSDSWLAHCATKANLQANHLSDSQVVLLNSLQLPSMPVDLLLIKIPKSLSLLEDQLHRLRPCLHAGTQIIAAGLVKSIHRSTLALFERLIGPTHTSLAKKKARLIHPKISAGIVPNPSPYPLTYAFESGTRTYAVQNYANVFSRQKPDVGTRFFVEHLPVNPAYQTILDLGCGNGLLGIIAAQANPAANIVFTDESFMAIASAKINVKQMLKQHNPTVLDKVEYLVTDCLAGVAEASVDLILNNPPFHQHTAVGDAVAWQMFSEAKSVLRQGGELWVIGNRHLGYHSKLKQLFGNIEVIASNPKFVLLKAQKP